MAIGVKMYWIQIKMEHKMGLCSPHFVLMEHTLHLRGDGGGGGGMPPPASFSPLPLT